jgi:hypothetical protein
LYYILANIYHYKGDTVNENKYKQLGDNAWKHSKLHLFF